MMTKKEMKKTTATDTERESIKVEKYTLNERTAIQKKYIYIVSVSATYRVYFFINFLI